MTSYGQGGGSVPTGDGDPAEVPPGGDEPFTDVEPNEGDAGSESKDLVDEMSEQSFPTSDPPSTWGGPDQS